MYHLWRAGRLDRCCFRWSSRRLPVFSCGGFVFGFQCKKGRHLHWWNEGMRTKHGANIHLWLNSILGSLCSLKFPYLIALGNNFRFYLSHALVCNKQFMVVRGHVLIISTITVILEPDSTICKICKFCKLTLQLCFRNNFLLSSSSVSFNSLLPLLLLLLGSLCQGLLEHFVRRTVENFCPTLGPENTGSNSHKGQAC